MSIISDVPQALPVLSRGKHRNPRKGACFMEFAGFLAGERWSDHPDCTHPLLAGLARCVNDFTSDEGRPLLAPMIPCVIGLTSSDPRVDVRIALVCARTALPVVSAERQRVMAVAVLSCERVLARLDGRAAGPLEETSRRALEMAPHAVEWARRLSDDIRDGSPAAFRRHAAPRIVACAAQGVAEACINDPDGALRDLLVDVIDECRSMVRPEAPPSYADGRAWGDACRVSAVR